MTGVNSILPGAAARQDEMTGMTNEMKPRATRRLAADEAGVSAAAELLRAGGLVAFPTETVYGLGADATDPRAVAGIYRAKGRPSFNPLIAHVADRAMARREGRFDAIAEKLAEAFWPGPLTMVLPLADQAQVCDLARAGLDSVGLRMPADRTAQALLAAAGRPVAAPSANLSGHVSPATAAHVLADLDGRIDAVLDGGACLVGVESTIVALLDGTPRLLRPGGVSRGALEEVMGFAPGGGRRRREQTLWRRACSPPIMRRGQQCGSTQRICARARRGWISAAVSLARLEKSAIFRRVAISPRRRPIFSPCCGRSTRAGAAKIAVAPIPRG